MNHIWQTISINGCVSKSPVIFFQKHCISMLYIQCSLYVVLEMFNFLQVYFSCFDYEEGNIFMKAPLTNQVGTCPPPLHSIKTQTLNMPPSHPIYPQINQCYCHAYKTRPLLPSNTCLKRATCRGLCPTTFCGFI